MEINTFWKIVLKGIGLWLLISSFYIIPQFYSTVVMSWDYALMDILPLFMISLLIMAIYVLIIRVFLFKSQWLIDILKLDKHFTSERIDLNIPESKLLSIIVIILGGFIFVEGLPELIREIFQFFQQELLIKDYGETGWILYSFIKTLTGYLIMTNSKFIVNLIDKQAKNDPQ